MRDDYTRPMRWRCAASLVAPVLAAPALAGPPYVTDDPAPTDDGHYEIYAFATGTSTADGSGGAAGIDFNYGAAPGLQLTVAVPVAWEHPDEGGNSTGLGNVEIAAKYRFLHGGESGWDVAFFPRLFLPASSEKVGDTHASLLLPFWLGKEWGDWSAFGGGGCAINPGGDSQDFCLAGWAVTRQVLPGLQLGAEIYHETADTGDGEDSTGVGGGVVYDLNEHYHLLAWAGPGIQNADETNRLSWYASVLFTF